jgi:hypothetical protein
MQASITKKMNETTPGTIYELIRDNQKVPAAPDMTIQAKPTVYNPSSTYPHLIHCKPVR